MKVSFINAGAALALLAALAGCGGKAQFTVKGSLINVNNPGLVLANGSDTVSVPRGATSFSFPRQIDYGTDYNITIQKQPDHMTCVIGNGSGSAGHTIEIQAVVQCTQNSYTLGGQYTGLKVDPADGKTLRSITLLNGSNSSVTLTSSATGDGSGDFTFGTPVPFGDAYGVTFVKPAPNNGLSCTVTNGVGQMQEGNVTNILVTCVEIPK